MARIRRDASRRGLDRGRKGERQAGIVPNQTIVCVLAVFGQSRGTIMADVTADDHDTSLSECHRIWLGHVGEGRPELT